MKMGRLSVSHTCPTQHCCLHKKCYTPRPKRRTK